VAVAVAVRVNPNPNPTNQITHTHTHTLRFNGHFPGEPELASCLVNSPSPSIHAHRFWTGLIFPCRS